MIVRTQHGKRIKTGLAIALILLGSGSSFATENLPENGFADSGSLVSQEISIEGYKFSPKVDPNFILEPLNFQMRSPRVIHFNGDRMFIGSSSGGVFWLDPPYTDANLLVALPGYPHSVVVKDQKIYIARTDDILVADYNPDKTSMQEYQFRQLLKLPGGPGHSSRTLKLGPDKHLYVSLGISGNCSDQWLDNSYPADDRRGGIYKIDQSNHIAKLLPFASGLRNPVGFDWTPDGAAIYASNNGPDHLGYDSPAEQFVRVTQGSVHGMPWYQYDPGKSAAGFFRDQCIESPPPFKRDILIPPEAFFPARNAPMDVAFIPKQQQGTYQGHAIVALHGSWATSDGESGTGSPESRRVPALVRVKFANGHATSVVGLVRGFQLPDGRRWGRPMGVAIGPDGNIYFTSDGGIHGLFRLRWRH